MTIEDDAKLTEHMSSATKLASDVATEARRQWAAYKDRMVKAADDVREAAAAFGKPSEQEREFMNASARAAASLAEVLVDFADAAFEATSANSEASRRKGAELLRKIVKVAVDDTLEDSTRTAQRTTRMLELRPGYAWATIYLVRGLDVVAKITLKLSGLEGDAELEIRTNRSTGNDPITLSRDEPVREERGVERFSAELEHPHEPEETYRRTPVGAPADQWSAPAEHRSAPLAARAEEERLNARR